MQDCRCPQSPQQPALSAIKRLLHTVYPAEEERPKLWVPGPPHTMGQQDSGPLRPTVSSSGMPLKAGWQRRAQTSKQSLEPETEAKQSASDTPVSLTCLGLCLTTAEATTRAQTRQAPWTGKVCPRGLHQHSQARTHGPAGRGGHRMEDESLSSPPQPQDHVGTVTIWSHPSHTTLVPASLPPSPLLP